MSNSAVVRALRRRISFYLNSPVFNKYGRSLKDFLIVCGLVLGTGFILLFVMFWILSDAYDGGFTSLSFEFCQNRFM